MTPDHRVNTPVPGIPSLGSTAGDPFLFDRDPGEQRADALVREFLLKAQPPEKAYRQDGRPDGYALIVPQLSGETMLTVPGLHEADFMYHGSEGTPAEGIADLVASAIQDSGADHLRLPLLSRSQASMLVDLLVERLPKWRLDGALAAISPVACVEPGQKRHRGSLRRAVSSAKAAGLEVEFSPAVPLAELMPLHRRRWGDNRTELHFRMLAALVDEGCAELVTARTGEGELVAAQLDIVGAFTRHYYYGVSDTQRAPGSGTAVLGAQWERFAGSEKPRCYSFGRGSERYKFRYAGNFVERFEIRGFFAPTPRLQVSMR